MEAAADVLPHHHASITVTRYMVQSWFVTFILASNSGKKNSTKMYKVLLLQNFSYQAALLHPDGSGTTHPCTVRARYAALYRTAIGDGLFCDVLHQDRADIALRAPNAIISVVASETIITVDFVDRGLLTLRQMKETKVDHGGSGSDIVSLEAPRNFGCPRYQRFRASDTQAGHLDHIRPGKKRYPKCVGQT